MPLTHEDAVSMRLQGSKLIVTTWSEHGDPFMLGLGGPLHPNTYEFGGRVVIRRIQVAPRTMVSPELLKEKLLSGEPVSLVIDGKRPRVEIDYEQAGESFYLDISVIWP